MKLLFRRKHDGRILKPIQTLDSYVRLQNAAGNRVWWAKKDKLPENFDVLTHDIERGDVLRDIRDGSMWIVEYVGLHGLRMQSRKDGVAGMTYFGLVNYERVGRKYCLRDRQPHERSSAIADAVNRVTHDVAQKTRVEFRKSQPAYATYDASKVRQHIDNARAQAAAMIQAGNDAKRFGIGVLLVYPDGSMKSTDPRGVILK